MRILVLNIEYPPLGGGASPVCKVMSELFAEAGHEVTVITSRFGNLSDCELINGVKIYRVNCWRQKINMSNPLEHLIYLKNAKKLLRKRFNSSSFDICHCHFLIPTGFLAYSLKKWWNLPYIVTIHGSDVPGYNPDRFQILHRFTKVLLKIVARSSSKIVSPSFYLMNLLTHQLKSSWIDDKVMVIPYPFKLNTVKAVRKERIIMSSGRLLKRKGFHTLINSVSSFDLGYEVHIFGDGPMMNELKLLANGSLTKVVLHGWVDSSSHIYQEFLAKSEIFVLMSSHENSSVSIMEAMEYSCAIISTNQTGCLEMVHDVGICLPVNDSQQLTNALSNLIEHPDQIKELGAKALLKLGSYYSPGVVAKVYLGIFQSMIDDK